MTRDSLDLQKIRRNWERAAATLPVRSPDRLASVPMPLDSYAVGAQLLERLRREVRDAFPEQQRRLAPFLDRAEACFEQLRAHATHAMHGAHAAEVAAELPELRAQLMAAMCDLEDICEAFLGLGR